MFENPKGVKGVVKNAFYTPNSHKERGNTYLDRERGENTEIFRYRLNEEGKMEMIQMRKF